MHLFFTHFCEFKDVKSMKYQFINIWKDEIYVHAFVNYILKLLKIYLNYECTKFVVKDEGYWHGMSYNCSF